MTDDPASSDWVPGPDDHWRGVIGVRYTEYLTPAVKARLAEARQRAAE